MLPESATPLPDQLGEDTGSECFEIDAFGLWPDRASSLNGLGGPEVSEDPAYVFHSRYETVGVGAAEILIDFKSLEGEGGILHFQINRVEDQPFAPVEIEESVQIPFSELVSQNGQLAIRVDGQPNTLYAILASSLGLARGSAKSVTISVNRYGEVAKLMTLLKAGQSSSAKLSKGPDPRLPLISNNRISFSMPTSQPYSPDQFDDREYRNWCLELGIRAAADPAQWGQLIILQWLRRADLLDRNSLGMVIGSLEIPILSWLSARAAVVQIGHREPLTISRLHQLSVNPRHMPSELSDFDFLICTHVPDDLKSNAAKLRFIREVVAKVGPGGLVIFLFDFTTAWLQSTRPATENSVRDFILAVATRLIADGAQVAPITFGRIDPPDISKFALAALRG